MSWRQVVPVDVSGLETQSAGVEIVLVELIVLTVECN